MQVHQTKTCAEPVIDDLLLARGRDVLIADIHQGLRAVPKRISSMFFYDDRGSQLFEEITRLGEYYPTRTEKQLLESFAGSQARRWSDLDIVELGSGDCSKISLLLEGADPQRLASIRYVPVDVSEFAVRRSADRLTHAFPGLAILGLVADFLTQLDCIPRDRRRLFCLLGSTIGNLSVSQRKEFLDHLAANMQPGDEFLLGVDLVKPIPILERAYNDGQGVTSAFNRNILRVVNDLARTDFQPECFDHVAFYNPEHARVEMHLRARRDMEVSTPLGGSKTLHLQESEMIHTENSHKFTVDQVKEVLDAAGLEFISCLQDPKQWFALVRTCKSPRGSYVGC